MHDFTAQRTLVKSPPELWSELSEVDRLAKHLEAFGEIKITKLEPEQTVAWEGEKASGTVSIEPSGWGTKVTLTASVEQPAEALKPAADLKPAGVHDETGDIVPERIEPPEPAAPEPEPAPMEPQRKRGLFARFFRWERRTPPTEQPVWVTGAQAPEPEPPAPEPEPTPEPEPQEPDPTQAVLESALEALGSAHHRPFSRG
jgi:hypothetical protein